MAWLKLDDNIAHHPKLLQAGPAAAWLWVCGIAYCQRHKTDGRIPREVLPWLGVEKPAALVAKLVAAGLWHDHGASFEVHDFLAWNDSAAERAEKSQERAGRQQRWREKRRISVVDASTTNHVDASTSQCVDAAPTPTPTPPPTPQPRPAPPPEGSADEAAPTPPRPPKLPPGRAGLLTSPGRWGVEHNDHVEGFCTFVCFPGALFREFAARVRGAGGDPELAETQVREWALAYRADFQGIPGDDMWSFWKHAWAATHGSNKPAPRPRGHAGGIDALIAQGRTQS